MRTFIVYLATVALLLCPYGCALKSAAAKSLGNEDRACCEECRAREKSATPSSGGDRDPAQPGPSEDGKSCVCEGAVFDAATRSAADAVLDFSLSWVAVVAAAPSSANFGPGMDRAGQPPNEVGGRLSRIAICSLLL
jgi:hypothetical protein